MQHYLASSRFQPTLVHNRIDLLGSVKLKALSDFRLCRVSGGDGVEGLTEQYSVSEELESGSGVHLAFQELRY